MLFEPRKIEVKGVLESILCFISYIDSSHGYDFLCVFLMLGLEVYVYLLIQIKVKS